MFYCLVLYFQSYFLFSLYLNIYNYLKIHMKFYHQILNT